MRHLRDFCCWDTGLFICVNALELLLYLNSEVVDVVGRFFAASWDGLVAYMNICALAPFKVSFDLNDTLAI